LALGQQLLRKKRYAIELITAQSTYKEKKVLMKLGLVFFAVGNL